MIFSSRAVKQQKDAAKLAAKKAVQALQVVAYGPSLKQTYYTDAQKVCINLEFKFFPTLNHKINLAWFD